MVRMDTHQQQRAREFLVQQGRQLRAWLGQIRAELDGLRAALSRLEEEDCGGLEGLAAGLEELAAELAQPPAKPQTRPPPPGQILSEEYLKPRGIQITELAAATGLSRKHLSDIVHERPIKAGKGRVSVTAETAVRLGRALGTPAELWLELQAAVDLYDSEAALDPAAVKPLPAAPAAAAAE